MKHNVFLQVILKYDNLMKIFWKYDTYLKITLSTLLLDTLNDDSDKQF